MNGGWRWARGAVLGVARRDESSLWWVLYGATGGAVVDRGDSLCVGLKMGKEEGAGCVGGSASTICRLSTSVLLAGLVLALLQGSRQRRLPVHQPSPISH